MYSVYWYGAGSARKSKKGEGTKMFKEIPNFTNYLVSEKGIVINAKTRKRLSQNDNGCGYLQVQFKDGKNHFVHRLVAMTFLQNPENKLFVDHINGNKQDNTVDNLRWVTASENCNAFGARERAEHRQRKVMATNVETQETITFASRNACANFFRCNKSNIKYGWIYCKGNKKNWIFELQDN